MATNFHGSADPLAMSAAQFEKFNHRKPRMAGEYDCDQAADLRNRGWQMIEVTRIGDDIHSYVKGGYKPTPTISSNDA